MPSSREGSSIPNTTFKVLRDGKVQDVASGEFFRGRRVILFALPGAYTPTCSTGHVPRFVELAPELRKHGIDDVICLSVNDPFVMAAWQRDQNADSITFLPDGDGAFTDAMGMLVDKTAAGLGKRSWRYSMVVKDGHIEKMFVEPDEPGDPFGVSDGDTALRYVDPSRKMGDVTLFARHGCPFCERAKAMLTERGIPFEAIYLGEGITMSSVRAVSGAAKVPQVFMEGKLIGGSDALQAFLDEKELSSTTWECGPGAPVQEETSNLVNLRPANSPNAFDLRRIGAHPDHWYAVAWSDELQQGKTLGRRFAGDPIVVYRGKGGQVFALEDRCAHRQVPLHLGVVCGDELKCHYHGWKYDQTGKCVDVPYLGKERLPNGVKSYPAREIDGLIFVFPGDPSLAESRLPKTLGMSQRKDYKTRRLNREVACHYSFMHENLFDMNHQFMHRKNMGSIKARCIGREHGDNWAQVEYTFSRTGGRPSAGERVIVDLVRKRGEAKKDFSDHMRIRTDYPTQNLRVWVGRDIKDTDDPVLEVWLNYTPLDAEQKTNRTYGYLSVKKPPVPGLIHAVWPFVTWFTERIFAEDKEIVEYEQAAYDAQGGDWNNEVFPAIKDLRGVLANCGKPIKT